MDIHTAFEALGMHTPKYIAPVGHKQSIVLLFSNPNYWILRIIFVIVVLLELSSPAFCPGLLGAGSETLTLLNEDFQPGYLFL